MLGKKRAVEENKQERNQQHKNITSKTLKPQENHGRG
jgi:hypothetical protein